MLLSHAGFRSLCLAKDVLLDVSEEAVSIEVAARTANLSPSHFIRQFTAVFGLTPHQFRTRARIEQAKSLLATGQHSVTDVCMSVGFSSLGSFSFLFRRWVGESPSAFQARAKELAARSADGHSDLTPGCLTLMTRLPADASQSFREA